MKDIFVLGLMLVAALVVCYNVITLVIPTKKWPYTKEQARNKLYFSLGIMILWAGLDLILMGPLTTIGNPLITASIPFFFWIILFKMLTLQCYIEETTVGELGRLKIKEEKLKLIQEENRQAQIKKSQQKKQRKQKSRNKHK